MAAVRRVGAAMRTASRMVVGGALMLLLLLVCSAWMQLAAAQTSCSPGSGYSLVSRTCEVCKPGTSSPGGVRKRCTQCATGYVAAKRGSRACTKCASNRMANADRTACVAPPTCRPGYGASQRSAVCTQCLAGFYSAGGQSACKFCPAGKVASARGSRSCRSCPAGQHANARRSQCVDTPSSGGGGGVGGGGAGTGIFDPACRDCMYATCVALSCNFMFPSAACFTRAQAACREKHPCINKCL